MRVSRPWSRSRLHQRKGDWGWPGVGADEAHQEGVLDAHGPDLGEGGHVFEGVGQGLELGYHPGGPVAPGLPLHHEGQQVRGVVPEQGVVVDAMAVGAGDGVEGGVQLLQRPGFGKGSLAGVREGEATPGIDLGARGRALLQGVHLAVQQRQAVQAGPAVHQEPVAELVHAAGEIHRFRHAGHPDRQGLEERGQAQQIGIAAGEQRGACRREGGRPGGTGGPDRRSMRSRQPLASWKRWWVSCRAS